MNSHIQRLPPIGSTTTTAVPTDYRYTGQRLESDLGIYYYNARWYDLSIGRFLQTDTLVPDPGNPLDYDRYSYVRNNPLRYTDPSGYRIDNDCGGGMCNGIYGPKSEQDIARLKLLGAGYKPKSDCRGDAICSDTYDTLADITVKLNRVPIESEMIYMTAATEYWAYQGYSNV